MDLADYTACDATELRRLIGGRELSAQEVHEAAIRAIEAVEPQLNAVVDGPYERAAARSGVTGSDATGADVSGGGALAGVPFAVKDTLPEAGRPLGFGSRLLDGYVARRDATLAERFRGAGLVCVARTATPEFAFNTDTAPVTHGATRNPWNPARSPGGSSGGAAALVAARALPLAHANDGGGSIRVPAAWCGLVGLKPSRGRVPLGPAVGEAVGGLAHEFAVTRTVRDAAALLDAVNGPAPGDRYYVSSPASTYTEALEREPPRLRVAVHAESFFGNPTEPDMHAAVSAAASALEQLGHRVEEACPTIAEESLRACMETMWSVDLAALAGAFSRLAGREAGPENVEAASWACVRHGREVSALDADAAGATVNAISRRWGRFLDEHDIFLCPTAPSAALPSGVPDQDDAGFTSARAWLEAIFTRIPFTPLANITGQPAISLPLGESADGMPLGVMLTAQTLREDLLLGVAAELERSMPWLWRRPRIDAAR